jgi:hypothetical protein
LNDEKRRRIKIALTLHGVVRYVASLLADGVDNTDPPARGMTIRFNVHISKIERLCEVNVRKT